MSRSDSPFRFVENPGAFREPAALIVRIPPAARGKEKLLGVLAQALRFPRYFGWNWDALEECLCDLSWLPPHIELVVLVHERMPLSPNGEQLGIYLDILREAIARRKAQDGLKLEIVFPEAARSELS